MSYRGVVEVTGVWWELQGCSRNYRGVVGVTGVWWQLQKISGSYSSVVRVTWLLSKMSRRYFVLQLVLDQ